MNQKIYLNLSLCDRIVFSIFFMAAVRKNYMQLIINSSFLEFIFKFFPEYSELKKVGT